MTWEKSGNEARELDNRQLHERTDRLSLFLFIPTLQFDRESLSKFWGHMGTNIFLECVRCVRMRAGGSRSQILG